MVAELTVNTVGHLAYRCHGIGYGVETDQGEYIYRGQPADALGKHEFESVNPVGSNHTLYLFDNEIEEWTV